jgi:hypothetical protein
MTELEAKAYKIALIWQDECRKEIPEEQYVRLKKNSDPRKSTLFKYCYKLARETKGVLPDNDLPLYVRAQIQILKSIKEENIHALIEPHCLVGEKAWKRWKFWKYKFKKKLNVAQTSEEIGVSANSSKVIAELNSDFDFLNRMNCFDFDSFKIKTNDIKKWLLTGELSFYYALMSPWVKKTIEQLEFDKIYYRSCLNPKIEQFFREKFSHEYS